MVVAVDVAVTVVAGGEAVDEMVFVEMPRYCEQKGVSVGAGTFCKMLLTRVQAAAIF